jgi:DNA-directed RNA polymerase specialized sigma24 family protein
MPTWQDSEDSELIQIAQEGESDAFGELYQRYAQIVFRFIYANLNNRLDAEDLTEEVFLRAWRSLGKYRQKGVPFQNTGKREFHSWPIFLRLLAMY